VPVPLRATAILEPAARFGTTGKRPRPGGESWQSAFALAYAHAAGRAVDLAGQLASRTEVL
jgi:hypothetical protein